MLLARWWNDGNVMAHAGFPHGLGTTAAKVAADITNDSDDTRRRLILLVENRNIGNHTADIGIKICESSFQEKGIGRCALSMLIGTLFRLGYTKIVLDTDLQNLRAQHVYELLGFQKLQINVDAWIDQLGQPRSSVEYVLTKETFHDFAV